MNREDMDLSMNEPIDNSIGTLDDFSNGRIVDFRNNSTGLRKGGQPFDSSNQLLSDQLCVL